ncbi:hypothetical protein HZH66_007668 [Vespula vulgaris]|uniref:Uncharacterized protein n=1 Tax=Vespula vulgaris TaxID=7454 RepID=A0A834JTT3_VESVU|nr:hypothetical protein HZH66_007668 [Vespula vulgaris]
MNIKTTEKISKRTWKHPLNATGPSIDNDFTQVQCGIIHILHILYYFFCFTLRFALWKDLDSLSPRVNLEIFTDAICDSENLSSRVDLEICTLSRDLDNLSPSVDLEIYTLSRDLDNLSPHVDLEIFADAIRLCFELRRVDLEIFGLSRDLDNLSPYVDLEIFTPLVDFENLSPRVDLEIFAPLRDFENLSARVNLEIFTDVIRVRTTTKWGLRPTFIIAGSVVRCTTTSELRNFHRCHSYLNAKWGYTPIRDNNKVGSLTDPYSYSFSCALNFEEWT